MEGNSRKDLPFSPESVREQKLQPVHAAVSALILLFSSAYPKWGLVVFAAWSACWYVLLFLFVYPEELRRIATLITVLRFVLFTSGAVLGLFLFADASYVPLFFFAFAGFTDFFDGLVARKTGVTDAGGFLDGETDALAVSILSLYALGAGHAPPAVLLAGLMRFIFYFPLKRFAKIESSSRYFKLFAKFACAAAVALLTASSAPVWQNRTGFWLASVLLLGISFLWELTLSIIAYRENNGNAKPKRREICGVLSLAVVYIGAGAYRWIPEYSWQWIFFPALEFTALLVILNCGSIYSGSTRFGILVPASLSAGTLLLFSFVEAFMQHTFRQPFMPFADIPYLKPLIEMTVGKEISNIAVTAGVVLIVLVSADAAFFLLRSGLAFAVRKPRISALLPVLLVPAALLTAGEAPLYARLITQLQNPEPAVRRIQPLQETPGSEEETEAAPGENEDDRYNLPGLKDAHLLFFIVESYGSTVFTNPEHRTRMENFYSEQEALLHDAGVYYASALLDSPTTGGRSWLAEGTLMSGVKLENQAVYDQFLEADSYTLLNFLEQAGYHTVMAAPGTTYLSEQWTDAFHFEEFLIQGDFGYNGPFLSFGAMPDQYLIKHIGSYVDGWNKPQPLFLQVLLTTSHTPFDVVPAYIDDWSSLGDGSIYHDLEHQFYDNGWLRGSEYPEGYTGSITYSLRTVLTYAEKLMNEKEFVFVLGDHQPRLPVREPGADSEVPLHLFVRDRELLEPWIEAGCKKQLLLSADTPVFGMEELFPMLRDIAGRIE